VIGFDLNSEGKLGLKAWVSGFPVFLDQFAFHRLACEDPRRRTKFVESVHNGAEVLFSVSNAAELCCLQGDSFKQAREFMDEIGPRWFPVELDAMEVVKREKKGMRPDQCCACARFMSDLLAFHSLELPKDQVLGVTPELFNLRHVMDWLAPQRDSVTRGKKDLDAALVARIKRYRAKHDADPKWLDRNIPALWFDPASAGTFAYQNLVRLMVFEAKSYAMMPGDGIDFCQAVIGSAYASVATLDKNWKRRIEALPKPSGLAPIYYEATLDKLVEDLEADVRVWNSSRRPSPLLVQSGG
jgi:hypothetical protein